MKGIKKIPLFVFFIVVICSFSLVYAYDAKSTDSNVTVTVVAPPPEVPQAPSGQYPSVGSPMVLFDIKPYELYVRMVPGRKIVNITIFNYESRDVSISILTNFTVIDEKPLYIMEPRSKLDILIEIQAARPGVVIKDKIIVVSRVDFTESRKEIPIEISVVEAFNLGEACEKNLDCKSKFCSEKGICEVPTRTVATGPIAEGVEKIGQTFGLDTNQTWTIMFIIIGSVIAILLLFAFI